VTVLKKIALLFITLLAIPVLHAQQRFALVIGNENYTTIPRLVNPVNDANDIAAVLQELGFSVDIVLNGSLYEMENAVVRLRNRLSVSSDSYGFFFYAGHGVQSNGENFLIPVDASIPSEGFLRQRTVSVQSVLDELNNAGNSLNIVVLDACRDNPFSRWRGGGRGLAVIANQPADSIIVFATSAGSVADDGIGRNGLFTEHLLNNLRIPGLDVHEVFRRTGADVARTSNRTQIPAIYNQFFGNTFLGSPGQLTPMPPARVAPATPIATSPTAPPVQPAQTPMPTFLLRYPPSINAENFLFDFSVAPTMMNVDIRNATAVVPPIVLSVDYVLPVGLPISMGFLFAFHGVETYSQTQWSSQWGNQWIEEDTFHPICVWAGRVSWHWNINSHRFDINTGFIFGYMTDFIDLGGLFAGAHLGVRLYLSRSFGLIVEASYPFAVRGGLTFKFNHPRRE